MYNSKIRTTLKNANNFHPKLTVAIKAPRRTKYLLTSRLRRHTTVAYRPVYGQFNESLTRFSYNSQSVRAVEDARRLCRGISCTVFRNHLVVLSERRRADQDRFGSQQHRQSGRRVEGSKTTVDYDKETERRRSFRSNHVDRCPYQQNEQTVQFWDHDGFERGV